MKLFWDKFSLKGYAVARVWLDDRRPCGWSAMRQRGVLVVEGRGRGGESQMLALPDGRPTSQAVYHKSILKSFQR